MSDVSIFLNTRISRADGNDPFSEFGNFCLTPVRYLFKGKTVKVIHQKTSIDILEVKLSYPHAKRNWLKTAVAIILFLPGLLIGAISKGIAYLSKTVRQEHAAYKIWRPANTNVAETSRLINGETPKGKKKSDNRKQVKKNLHTLSDLAPSDEGIIFKKLSDLSKNGEIINIPLKPLLKPEIPEDKSIKYQSENGNVTLGSADQPLNLQMIQKTLEKIKSDREKSKTTEKIKALIIYAKISNGQKTLLNADPGIIACNPSKLILIGAVIVHSQNEEVTYQADKTYSSCLDNDLMAQGNWWSEIVRPNISKTFPWENTFVKQTKVDSVEEGLTHQPPLMPNVIGKPKKHWEKAVYIVK